MPKKQVDKVLVLARREDLCNYAKRLATDLGFEAYGATNNEDGKALLEGKHTFCACVLGNVLVNDKRFAEELQESMRTFLGTRRSVTSEKHRCTTMPWTHGMLFLARLLPQ